MPKAQLRFNDDPKHKNNSFEIIFGPAFRAKRRADVPHRWLL